MHVGLPGGTTDVEYRVDGLGRRVEKRKDGETQRAWIYTDRLNPIAEYDPESAAETDPEPETAADPDPETDPEPDAESESVTWPDS